MTDNELICALANALRSMTRPFGAQPADYVQAGRALKEYTKWKNTPVSNATEVKIASLKAQVQLCREGAEAAEKARRKYENHRLSVKLAAAKLAEEEAQWCAAIASGIAIGMVVASVMASFLYWWYN